ncbi:MAG: PIN domain-containing protein [Nanoarchaeota archaeon]
MGEIKTYFFDTYAFYELIHGNSNYIKYSSNIVIVTTKLNLMELHYGIMLLHGKEKADEYYDQFIKFSVEFDDKTIKQSNEFKMQNKDKKLSYIDCLGYITAKLMNIPFLTGDKGFQDIENVEYVK